jgi:hypothetical protein
MITQNNLKTYIESFSQGDINEIIYYNADYIGCYINGCESKYAVPVYDDADAIEVESAGGFVCDKDHFFELFKESESINLFLLNLI